MLRFGMPERGIYVESEIKAELETVWRLTQEPVEHQQWDLRFSSIEYLPCPEGEPQRFLYATRIGFGAAITGGGESTGTQEADDRRSSALRFWSDDRLSLIRQGSGYWQYREIRPGRVQFLTWYDYKVRFGRAGWLLDRACFRPLIGWATAWSFDRLRLWAEDGVHPRETLRWTAIYTIARAVLVVVWMWHGLVPKLLFPQADERVMLAAQRLSVRWLPFAGAGEILLALAGLVMWRRRGFLLLTASLMVAASAAVLRTPEYLTRAFNPVTLNLTVLALAAVAYTAWPRVAFAGRCRRRPLVHAKRGR